MREIVLDTETTGLEPKTGDRIVEIGCIELINHLPTDQKFHVYINPQRDMPTEAERVHGLSEAFLKDKPTFAQVAQGFVDFIGDAPLIIHNAPFDMGFLNVELARCGFSEMPPERAIDTLDMARKRFPGAKNNLDALCKRFNIDNSHRTLHGALLDSEILAAVYLEMIGGRQPGLELSAASQTRDTTQRATHTDLDWRPSPRPTPLSPRIDEAEKKAHDEFVARLGSESVWARIS